MSNTASIIPRDRLALLAELARSTTRMAGDAAEVGVFHGGSAAVLARAVPCRPLHLFDTFEGLPEPGPHDGPYCGARRFKASAEEVQRQLPQAIIHVGHFTRSTPVPAGPYAFVHIDVDQYTSTLDALTVFYPLMEPGGIIMVDDYGGAPTPGATKAVDDFIAALPAQLVNTPSCGGLWFRRTMKGGGSGES